MFTNEVQFVVYILPMAINLENDWWILTIYEDTGIPLPFGLM